MPLPTSGQIAASDISSEFGRGVTYFDIYTARNGGYGAINDASGYRPNAPHDGRSGYGWHDWWGYHHGASRPYVYIFKYEAGGSCSIRLYKYNPYGIAEWAERWYFYNIGPWHDASGGGDGYNGASTGVRTNDRLTFYWYSFGWGNFYQYTFKAVYSTYRGYVLSWGCDPVGFERYGEVSGVQSGEVFYTYSVEYYC